MNDMFEKPVVVIDNGSHLIKAGFSCDNHPIAVFRTVVARPNNRAMYDRALNYYDIFIGDDAVEMPDYDWNSPVVKGRIVNWENMERVWHHIFYRELKVAPEDRAVMLACSPNMTMNEKYSATKLLFETLNVPALCIQPQCTLSLYGSAQTTGIVVDLGYDSAIISPVYEGNLLRFAQVNTGYSGADINKFYKDSLDQRNIDLGEGYAEVIDDMVSRTMHVTRDVTMKRRGYERPYQLPSGKTIDVFDEAFLASEMFFQPKLIQDDTKVLPLQDAIFSTSLRCDEDLRSELHAAIVTSGGFSLVPGLNERLRVELERCLEPEPKVLTSIESNVVAWMGAATFAATPETKNLWISKKQFEEHGARIIRNRFG